MILLLAASCSAASLTGTVYNVDLTAEPNVLVEVDSQKYLAKDGKYQFTLPHGTYTITATKADVSVQEQVQIRGDTVFDLFLLPTFTDEDDLWADVSEELDDVEVEYEWWRYLVAGLIVLFALQRWRNAHKKYGSFKVFRRRQREETTKTVAQHAKEIASEPGYREKVLTILKKHDGRISQKQLRKEMLYLSEAKVSLLLTQLEHEGKVEKIKKGRGNVIILKNDG